MKTDKLHYLYSSTSLSFVMRIAGVGLLFSANVLLARSLSVSEYGLYAYIVEVAAFGAVIACLGMDQVAVRIVPDCVRSGDRRAVRRFIAAGMSFALLTSLALGIGLYAAYRWQILPQHLSPVLLSLALGLLFALSILRFGQEIMRGARRIALSQLFEQLAWPTLLLVVGALMWTGLAGFDLVPIVALQVTLYIAASILLFVIAGRIVAVKKLEAGEEAAVELATPYLLGIGLPLAASALLSVFLNRGDILALAFSLPTEAIAPYTAASRYAALMVLGLAAGAATSAALMRDYWRDGDRASLQHCVDRTTGVAVLFSVPLAVLFMAIPELMLSIYGPDYVTGATVLRILAVAQLLNAVTGPVAVLVIVCELQRQYTLAMILCALLMLVLLAVLIPLYGTHGAAASTFISLVSLNLSLAVLVKRRTGIASWVRPEGLRLTMLDGLTAFRVLLRSTPWSPRA